MKASDTCPVPQTEREAVYQAIYDWLGRIEPPCNGRGPGLEVNYRDCLGRVPTTLDELMAAFDDILLKAKESEAR